jgi:hypothetical protein
VRANADHAESLSRRYLLQRYGDELMGLFVLGCVLLVVAVTYALYAAHKGQINANRITAVEHKDNHRISLAELGACVRLQRQREGQNVSEARQYLILNAIAHNRRAMKVVRHYYEALSDTTSYRPPTNCPQAVTAPQAYHQPGPIPFTVLGAVYANKIVNKARYCARRHITNCPQPVPSASILRRDK